MLREHAPTLDAAAIEAVEESKAPTISEEVIEALTELETDGRFRPEDVLDAARDEDSVLHHFFEWDDGKAAEAHRIEQARRLIRSVHVEITVHERVLAVPRYVRDPAAGKDQGYVTHEQLRNEPENAKALAAYELSRAQALIDRTRGIVCALGLEKDFARLLRSLSVIRQTVSERA